ncbi:LacI family DNA-binding transcriptional regulator [Saccharospirillum mangrovi]|uniref:LacI family DNA-binding transcriptional regulator n=1 Tax=Saccharospirillum mangrovi TaxID=2161747 RepID=UPI000D3593EC|nr:LacI family DNA-binding transcriptional regulator [Saccharospirillum mangrovi]
MSKRNQVTIRDIAKQVNMTTITVSRALNHPEKVKPSSLEKILKAVDELNYVPNAFAKNLKSKSSNIIGVVTDSIDNPFYAEMIKSVSREAKSHNYSIMLFDTDGVEELEMRAVETLLGYNVAGILLSPILDNLTYRPSYIDKLIRHHMPVVMVDRVLYDTPFSRVVLNNMDSGYQMGRHLMAQNIRRILIISGPMSSPISKNRLAGFLKAVEESGKVLDYDVVYADYTMNPAYDKALHYLKYHEIPDAILGINELITLGAMKAVRDFDLEDRNVLVAGVSQLPYAEIYGITYPTIAHDPTMTGVKAMELLFQEMNSGDNETKEVVIDGKLQV